MSRELRIGLRNPSDTLNPLVFFLILTTLFALGLSALPVLHRAEMAVTLIWIGVSFSIFLPLERTFFDDHADGSLELILSHQSNLYGTALAYGIARWLLHALPVVLLLPLSIWMLGLELTLWPLIVFTIAVGSSVFIWFGILGSSLALGISRTTVLLSVLILPLYLPVTLLGIGIFRLAVDGQPYSGSLAALLAIATGATTCIPIAVAAMLRNSLEY